MTTKWYAKKNKAGFVIAIANSKNGIKLNDGEWYNKDINLHADFGGIHKGDKVEVTFKETSSGNFVEDYKVIAKAPQKKEGTEDDRIFIFIPKDYSEDSDEVKNLYNKRINDILKNVLDFRQKHLKENTDVSHEFWVPNFDFKNGKRIVLHDESGYPSHYFSINKYKEREVFTGKGLMFILEIKGGKFMGHSLIDDIREEYEEFINEVRFAIEKDFKIINFGDGTLKTFEAKTKLDFLERDIREFIEKEIITHVDESIDKHIPKELLERIEERNLPIEMDSLNLSELPKIIKHNWESIFKHHFENKFKSKRKLKDAFAKINNIRNKIAHNRGEINYKDIETLNEIYNKFNEVIFGVKITDKEGEKPEEIEEKSKEEKEVKHKIEYDYSTPLTILKCVWNVRNEEISKDEIVSILIGSKEKFIEESGFNKSKHYGSLSNLNKKDILNAINKLIEKNYLEEKSEDSVKTVKISRSGGIAILKKEEIEL